MNGQPHARLRSVDELELDDDALHLLVRYVNLERVEHGRPVGGGVRGRKLLRNHPATGTDFFVRGKRN